MIRQLSEQECRYAMEHGEFSDSLIGVVPITAIILTQSWCPQWERMHSYLEAAHQELATKVAAQGSNLGIAILYVEYDREPWFEEFMAFKEDVFGNREVPYIRYYRNGKLTGESNYLSMDGFVSRLI